MNKDSKLGFTARIGFTVFYSFKNWHCNRKRKWDQLLPLCSSGDNSPRLHNLESSPHYPSFIHQHGCMHANENMFKCFSLCYLLRLHPFPEYHACFFKKKNEVRAGVNVLLSPVSTNHTSSTSSKQFWRHWITRLNITVRPDWMEALRPITALSCFCLQIYKWNGRSKKQQETQNELKLEKFRKAEYNFPVPTTPSMWPSFCVGQLMHEHQTVRQAKDINTDYSGRNRGGGQRGSEGGKCVS